MKNNERERALFAAISDIDPALIEGAAEPKMRLLQHRWVRVAAIAAAILIAFLSLALFPIDDHTAPSFFSIYVYANETESVELNLNGNTVAYSNVVRNSDSGNNVLPEYPTLFPSDDPPVPPRFKIELCGVEHKILEVLCNGKLVARAVYNVEKYQDASIVYHFGCSLQMPGEPIRDYEIVTIVGTVEEESVFEIMLYDENENLLQKNTISVQPAEEGYIVTLQDIYIADVSE